MVRGCRLATALSYCCPCLQELLSPRDVSVIGLAILVLGAALLFSIASRLRGQEELLNWSKEPWQEADCFIHQVGIMYTGDCNVPQEAEDEEPYDYGAWPPVKKSSREAPVAHYTRCPEDAVVSAKQEQRCPQAQSPKTIAMTPSKDPEGPVMPRYNLVVCRNSFLPWALVEIQTPSSLPVNTTMDGFCSYKAGLPQWSGTQSLPIARRYLDDLTKRRGASRCWVLAQSTCLAVGLHRP